MKVLVSGGTGLVGRYIVNGLLAAGHSVTVGGRNPPVETLFASPVQFRRLELDPVRDQSAAFDGMDGFVHCAFDHVPGRYRGGEGSNPTRFRHRNLDGSNKLFETARAAGASRVVFLSSRAVYDGAAPGTALTEDMAVSPTSLYGQIKLACEDALRQMSGPSFATSSLRATGIYGGLRPNKWDGLFADLAAGRALVPRAGTEVHGDDVAQAVCLMLETDAAAISGQSFNLSDITVDTRMIVERLGKPADMIALETLAANEMSTDKVRSIGWQPSGMSRFEETMRELADTISDAN